MNLDVETLFDPDPSKPIAGAAHDPYQWLVIDGGGLAVTSWATHRSLDHAEDRVRATIYVFLTTMASLSRLTHERARIVMVWDGHDNRRNRRGRHPWYKHGRGSLIDRAEVRVATNEIAPLLDAIGVAQTQMDGFEADDVVATVAREASEIMEETVLIFSDDKDFIQSITESVHLCRRSLQGMVLSQGQCELLSHPYGEHYLCMKALMGDSGDNIKGLVGIGEKKAADIMASIPTLFDDLREGIEPEWQELLERNTYRALIRSGRRMVSPAKIEDIGFCRKFAYDRGVYPPEEFDVPDRVCLQEAAWMALHCYDLVRFDTHLAHPKLEFPDVNVERIPGILARLDMASETDLLSSLYVLAGMRDPSITPPRAAGVRSGAAIRDDKPAPSKEAF